MIKVKTAELEARKQALADELFAIEADRPP